MKVRNKKDQLNLRILLVHNFYQYRGGEEQELFAEQHLLAEHGHRVELFTASNDQVMTPYAAIKTALNVAHSKASRRRLAAKIWEWRPDIVHVHNFFPLLSPSIYDACIEQGVPVVQTLHNYRLLCAGALLMRKGRICNACLPGSLLHSVLHGCYKNSRLATLAVAYMIAYHRSKRTWHQKVDAFVVCSNFARRVFSENGINPLRIWVKPSLVYPDPQSRASTFQGKFFIYAGRLSAEKGILTLLRAWRQHQDVPLKIAGEGPLRKKIELLALEYGLTNTVFLGQVPHNQILDLMKRSCCLIFPSECYENFPVAVAEAYACGVPVIASRLGAMEEIVNHGATGLHFSPGSPSDLASKVEWAQLHPSELTSMGAKAREKYERLYAPEKNYTTLMAIYEMARRSPGVE